LETEEDAAVEVREEQELLWWRVRDATGGSSSVSHDLYSIPGIVEMIPEDRLSYTSRERRTKSPQRTIMEGCPNILTIPRYVVMKCSLSFF
jgi:hypothetical protein